jgi:general secretion pathway protein J
MALRTRGFTLLELLVALVVFAALAALVYGTLRVGSRSWESGNERIAAVDNMRLGWTFVHRSLSNARVVPTLLEEGVGIHFFGHHDALEFVADLPAYLGSGGLHAIALAVEPAAETGARRLVLRATVLNEAREQVPTGEETGEQAVLADDVAALSIRYFGRAADEDFARWHDTWLDQSNLPVLTRVDVQPADGPTWPTLIAHSRLGPELNPEFDAPEAGEDAFRELAPDLQEPIDET